jgi:MFS family permease
MFWFVPFLSVSCIEAHSIQLVLAAGLASFNYGYMNNVISGSFGQVSFIAKFLSGSNAASLTDAIVSGYSFFFSYFGIPHSFEAFFDTLHSFFGFALIGAIIQAPISNKWGRKHATFTAAILLTIGGALQSGAVDIAMFIVGRYIAGIGCGIVMSNTPVYMSEISPAHTRGLLVGLQGNCIVLGYVTSSAAALGFHFVGHDYNWRLNFVLATAIALTLLLSLIMLPESPRWLVEHGRKEAAAKILERIHQSPEDPDATYAHAEMAQIAAQVEIERSLPTGYLHIWRTPSLRKRMICTLLVWTMGLATGSTVLANLTPTLFGSLGYSTVLQLGLSVVWVVCLFLGCFVCVYLLDRVGRVKLLGKNSLYP